MDKKTRQRVEEAERLRRALQPDEARYLPCGHYAPEPVTGKPPPPASECQVCKQEAMRVRPGAEPYEERVRDPDPATPRQFQLMEAFYEKHPEKRPGGGLSRVEQERLVAMMNTQREEEVERERQEAARWGQGRPLRVVHLGAYGLPDWRG